MKKSEIKVGYSYSNGKGRVRKVIDIGPEYKLYSHQMDDECLCYEIVQDGTKKNLTAGKQCSMTVVSFAAWAKEKLPLT